MIRGGSNEAWLLNWIRIPNGFADNPLEGILRCTSYLSKKSPKKGDHGQLTDYLKESPPIWDI